MDQFTLRMRRLLLLNKGLTSSKRSRLAHIRVLGGVLTAILVDELIVFTL